MRKIILILLITITYVLAFSNENAELEEDVFNRSFMAFNIGMEDGGNDAGFLIFDAGFFYQRKNSVYSLQFCNGSAPYLMGAPYKKGIILKHRELNLLYNFDLIYQYKSRNLFLVGAGAGLIIQTVRNKRLSYENWSNKTEYLPSIPINISYHHLGKKGFGTSLNAYVRIYEKQNIVGCSFGFNFGGISKE